MSRVGTYEIRLKLRINLDNLEHQHRTYPTLIKSQVPEKLNLESWANFLEDDQFYDRPFGDHITDRFQVVDVLEVKDLDTERG